MEFTGVHGELLSRAFEHVLGDLREGAMAFVRCLTPDQVKALGGDLSFAPTGWQVLRVAGRAVSSNRTITADQAVELRENKGMAVLLVVDTESAGAGMDGIYSAAREVREGTLFREAKRLAGLEISRRHGAERRRWVEQAIKKARGRRSGYAVSQWAEFDFLCRAVANMRLPGAYLHLLSLWPVGNEDGNETIADLNTARMFVDRLLGAASSNLTPVERIEALRLDPSSQSKRDDLERFLHSVDTKPLLEALERLADREDLWVGPLRVEAPAQTIQGIELVSWRNRNGTIARWSGLTEDGDADDPPALILNSNADRSGRFSTLEVRWKTKPVDLEKNAAEYRVSVQTGSDEELAVQEIPHSARSSGERCRFSDDDFSTLDDDTVVSAQIVVEVIGNTGIDRQESEEFLIRFGEVPELGSGSAGARVRAFSEGLAELKTRESATSVVSASSIVTDSKGFVVMRTPIAGGRRKSFRVFCPALISEIEREWVGKQGEIGRWTVKVRGSGDRAGDTVFHPFEGDDGAEWSNVTAASRNFARSLKEISGVGQVYDETATTFRAVREFLSTWVALLESGNPLFALANTVEVQSLSGRTIGLIVVPFHPLRVAWHAAYDNLVLNAAFEQEQTAKDIRTEFASLDGTMFPAFLPNPNGGTFVFADTLGFHAVGMVPDTDKEPKAAVAILSRALGVAETTDTAPTVDSQSATVLGDEILKYIDCHKTDDGAGHLVYASQVLRIHGMRAGDGRTIARSLGAVHQSYHRNEDDSNEESDEWPPAAAPVFSLDLYPSAEQRGVAGRFIAEAREKRRSGAGVLAAEDRWMLESLSLPGGVNMPRLRWARKERQDPNTAAHLTVAFDTFESRVVASERRAEQTLRPFYAFGLLSFFERTYSSLPSPIWESVAVSGTMGEKHPSRRSHTEVLVRMQSAIQGAVARQLGAAGRPILMTEISPEKADSLRDLHRLSDWVITLDRNAGIEYFDSPRDNQEVYDSYVIDCVPEREDLGCLQLITSTSNLEEVRNLLDGALDQMGLSHSRRNAEFLLGHLKALSGRLAIRLTGHRPVTSELIALAVAHANCENASPRDDCWVSLNDGFLVPVDDVMDLLPPLAESATEGENRGRPDLLYITVAPRGGLVLRFIEVKYRRHLRTARSPELLGQVDRQTQSLRKRWDRWYHHQDVCASFRAIRRAKLARVLQFYLDKAYRHTLPAKRHQALSAEIDRMIEKGGDYSFAGVTEDDLGWVLCPEFSGLQPLKISQDNAAPQTFLFGPDLLPDSDIGPVGSTSEAVEQRSSVGSAAVQVQLGVSHAPQPATARKQPSVDSVPSSSSPDGTATPVQLGTDTLTNSIVNWRLGVDRNPHLLIAGLPGMGKTTCLVRLCEQMIAANVRPVVFSYHQDIDQRLEEAIGDIRFVDFHGLGFNPLKAIDRSQRMAHLDIAGAMRDIFTAIFPELGDIQGDSVRKAIKESFEEVGWPSAQPAFKRFLEILRSHPKPDRGLRTLLARLGELDDYGFFDLSDESQGNLWEIERPAVIRIHTTQNDNLQRAFAYLVFYGLYKDMFRRGVQGRITHALIFDEAHRAARLKLIPTMAKECRKYGISLVLASQEARDFDVSVFSAIANYLVLRSTDTDARFLVRNVSNSKQERILIDRIKQMDRFKALYFSEGKSRPSHIALTP